MERLTTRQSPNKNVLKCQCQLDGNGKINKIVNCSTYCNCRLMCNNCGIQEAINLLASYEDTGLMPEEINTLNDRNVAKRVDKNDCCPICHTYGKDDDGVEGEFCPNCGQRLDWGYEL